LNHNGRRAWPGATAVGGRPGMARRYRGEWPPGMARRYWGEWPPGMARRYRQARR